MWECACEYRGVRYPGAGVIGGCESSHVGTGNWTQVLCKSRTTEISPHPPDYLWKRGMQYNIFFSEVNLFTCAEVTNTQTKELDKYIIGINFIVHFFYIFCSGGDLGINIFCWPLWVVKQGEHQHIVWVLKTVSHVLISFSYCLCSRKIALVNERFITT